MIKCKTTAHQKMKSISLQIAFELTIYILYGFQAAEKYFTWVVISCSVIIILIAFSLMIITYCTCCRNMDYSSEKYEKKSSEENTSLNQTYKRYSVVDNGNLFKTRMSQYSTDTDHEFSYYDTIIHNNRPASEVATMKMLQ